ncbi:hypothetical protein D3C76_1054630 [compost metagenome]|uniref:Uncharacterized protein n=1 Tax=Pseudomonas jinjuensis TaxID=198616 RepID=A0A1H0AQZ4_9PSED|nr:hypothetical protein SAMN05216193_102339 [Pseudomonas jinjuensis]
MPATGKRVAGMTRSYMVFWTPANVGIPLLPQLAAATFGRMSLATISPNGLT